MILLQGAMDLEIRHFLSVLDNQSKKIINGYAFYPGKINGIDAVISKTQVGSVNSAISTMLGIIEFHPEFIVNQGIAGAHTDNLRLGDIIIGKNTVNLNLLRTPVKGYGQGSDSLSWEFIAGGGDKLCCDYALLAMFEHSPYTFGRKYIGTLGSGDIFSREADRIYHIHNECSTLCEDMESFSVYTVCSKMNVPCLGIRTISNNELSGQTYLENHNTEEIAQILQKYIIHTLCNKKSL